MIIGSCLNKSWKTTKKKYWMNDSWSGLEAKVFADVTDIETIPIRKTIFSFQEFKNFSYVWYTRNFCALNMINFENSCGAESLLDGYHGIIQATAWLHNFVDQGIISARNSQKKRFWRTTTTSLVIGIHVSIISLFPWNSTWRTKLFFCSLYYCVLLLTAHAKSSKKFTLHISVSLTWRRPAVEKKDNLFCTVPYWTVCCLNLLENSDFYVIPV